MTTPNVFARRRFTRTGTVRSPNQREKTPLQPNTSGLGVEDYAQAALRFMEVEIEAHTDLDDLPVSTVQIDNRGYTVWLAERA